jgi:hypothetical protein
MESHSVTGLLLGTLSLAAVHALIPSHWLSFALVGRMQRWSVRRTLLITALAGTGHVLMTVVVGLVLAAAGKAFWNSLHIPHALERATTSLLLIALGVYFALFAHRGHHGCTHKHDHDYHAHPENGDNHTGKLGSVTTVFGALALGMTLSPCLELLGIYVGATQFSWTILLGVSALMAVTTLSIMLTLVWLTVSGLQRWNLRWLERKEGPIVGGILILLGILLFFV